MNVTETNIEGLKRELKVVIGADELEQRLSARLDELKDSARLKGFRPGHVPKAHLRKIYGRSVMAEVVQKAVADTSREAIEQRQELPAAQPTISLPEDEAEVEKIFAGSSDLAYTMSFEVLPKFDLMDFGALQLERPVSAVTDEDIAKAVDRIAQSNLVYGPKEGPATTGDRLIIDFVGSIEGEPFEGGSAEDAQVVLGSKNFIPGFEEGLEGAAAGEARSVEATFPEHYPEALLAGKPARFEVTVKEVESPVDPVLDDEFAARIGLESMDKLREMVKRRLEEDRTVASRQKLKRAMLDALNAGHSFELPPSLVNNEFEAIWKQVNSDMERTKKSFEDEGTSEEKARAEYRDIAARRVRLGLILSEVGTRNEIKISDEEVNRALLERIRQFPGQERKVYDFYRNNPQMLAEIRAPLYEDKVVDYIAELAKVTDKPVTVEELYTDPDGELHPIPGMGQHHHDHEHHHHDHDHDHHHDHDHDHDHHGHEHHHRDHDHHHEGDHDHRNE